MAVVRTALVGLMVLWPALAGADGGLTGAVGLGVATEGHHFDDGDTGAVVSLTAIDAELGYHVVVIGARVGLDFYGDDGSVPRRSVTTAVRGGVRVPFWRDSKKAGRVFSVTGSVEVGRHGYEVGGSESEFLGPTVSYSGPMEQVAFVGARAGLGFANYQYDNWGFEARAEVIGSRDSDEVDLSYTRRSCGGLFNSGCDSSSGRIRMGGGYRVGGILTVALRFGR